ncbi:PIKK family atypical protein kinase [Tritrichomonas foetus]|uniref:Serine/threonine-protein kinase TOR n=1 Tax=Tritrichomonas foetus TaxID=1144522 RepID=A0A1J4KCI5_9EUKA|nr:PIKK family atypical protein kinase [Tritrichomonas foetus]|eukprot:OHT07404.1 PIKK family atypical protein kinase [Tritrichomonas foetus]
MSNQNISKIISAITIYHQKVNPKTDKIIQKKFIFAKMNLSTIEIGSTCSEMIQELDVYYHEFFREVIRMSNITINDYFDKYLQMLEDLIIVSTPQSDMRAAIGVLSLHRLGYRKFDQLTHIFDKLIPQKEDEYVKFTSYIAGRLVHHPDTDQTHYVSHLFKRIVGWITVKGRRQRLLAASSLLCSLSENAGNSIIFFIPTIKTSIWHLISLPFPKLSVLKSTAKAISLTTRSILRYGRGELESYLDFLSELSMRLLNFGNSLKYCAGLLILTEITQLCPDYFIKDFLEISDLIRQSTSSQDCPEYVRIAAFKCAVSLAKADPKQFSEIFALTIMDRAKQTLLYDPLETVNGLCDLCKAVPNLMEPELNNIKMISNTLIRMKFYDAAFRLLEQFLPTFYEQLNEFFQTNFNILVSAPITNNFKLFFVKISSIPDIFSDDKKRDLSQLIESKLTIDPITSLHLISEMDPSIFLDHLALFKLVIEQTNSQNLRVRCASAAAIFNLSKSLPELDKTSLIRKLLAKATLDQSTIVRHSFLKVIENNCTKEFASTCFLNYYKIFLNDDSNKVRKITLKILAKLANFNPIAVTSITRVELLDYFFVFQKIPSIRQQAKSAKLLPYLVKASLNIVKTFSKSLILTLENVLSPEYNLKTYQNFIEQNSVIDIQIGVINSLAIIAPYDQDSVSQYAQVIIHLLCSHLHTQSHRNLVLSILHTFQVLLSPQASTVEIRTESTEILGACTTLLAETRSRKIRIAIFKVVGTIGVLDVHQKPPLKSCESPKNVDDNLARQFFQPGRDIEGFVDDSLLLNSSTIEQYNLSFVSSSLLEIFQDESQRELYYDTAAALVEILSNPRMSYLVFFDSLATRLLEVIETSQSEQKKDFISLFTKLVKTSTLNISPFVSRALEITKDHFNDEFTLYSLDLVLAFLEALGNGFSPYTSDTVSLLVRCLDDAKTRKKDVCRRVLEAFSILGQFATDFRSMIVLQVCDAVVCEQTLNVIRTMALETLRVLVDKVDVFFCIGPVFRALKYGISTNSREAALQLAYALIIRGGESTTKMLFEEHLIPEFSLSVEEATKRVTPPAPHFLKKKATSTPEKSHIFSEESVISRAVTPNLGLVRHLESWMNSLILTVISSSPSSPIRACQTIANVSPALAKRLFRPAFFSCWQKMSESSRQLVTNSIHQLLLADERYDTVVRDVLDLLVFMDKIEHPLEIPMRDVINACIRYGCYTFALKLFERVKKPQPEDVLKMIEVYLQLSDWTSAVAVWQKFFMNMKGLNETKLFTKLRMWDRAEAPFKELYTKTKDPNYFVGLLETLSKLAKWNDLIGFLPIFDIQKKHQKQKVSQYFAEAAIHLGKWDELNRVLDYSPIGSIDCNLLNALNSLHNGDWDKVDQCVDHGFSLLASQPFTFWEDKHRIHREMMLVSQQLIEIVEMKNWLSYTDQRTKIENLWDERLKTAPKDFELWFELIGNRLLVTGKRTKSLIQFFQLKSVSLGTKIHTNAFDMIFPNYDPNSSPDLDRLCNVVAKWNIGEKAKALEEIEELVENIGPDLKTRANFFYAQWLLESDDTMNMLTKAYKILKRTVKLIKTGHSAVSSPKMQASYNCLPFDPLTSNKSFNKTTSWRSGLLFSNHIMKNLISDVVRVNILRKWASVNSALIPLDKRNAEKYINNSITALNECIRLSPEFPDVAQLLNLFFEHANRGAVFESTNKFISNLPPALLLQAFPQILIQISHPSENVAKFVYDLILNLLEKHYHAIIFSIHVVEHSKVKSRAHKASELLQDFRQKEPEIANEVKLIRDVLLRAAVTWYEKTLAKLQDAVNFIDRNDREEALKIISSIFTGGDDKNPKCVMHQQYLFEYGEYLQTLQQALAKYNDRPSNITWGTLTQISYQMMNDLERDTSSKEFIQLSSISEELVNKSSFNIAVPGTYKPNKNLIKIHYFVGQLGVYATRQQPKNVCIKGDDGNFYQYLLKGHEDLRLDERLMQFFKLINSLVKKETVNNAQLIQTMSVIPLSLFHGLVQWVKGTDTLKAIVEQMRKLHGRQPMGEFELIEKLSTPRIDDLLPVQRMQVILKICKMVPDTEISNFMWLKAENAEIWMKQTNTFAISNAVMSIVGYIIGLGDRHPSNLLMDRFTGKVVHIDFGDSFERAATRPYKPEIVPFRLTRMMVRAMGITGVDGPFRNTFITMSQMLRDNRRVLLMVLAIFVQEPLVDPDNLIEEARVNQVEDENSQFGFSMKRSNSVIHSIKNVSMGTLYRSTSKSTFEVERGEWDDYFGDEVSNAEVRDRVKKKLMGRDFEEGVTLGVEEQADRLIESATNIFNLAKLYNGWFPFW